MSNLAELARRAKPSHLIATYEDFTVEDIKWIVSQFAVSGWVKVAPFPGRGNINIHTYEVTIGHKEYLLQKVNSGVFTVPERVMASMQAVLNAQRDALKSGYPAPSWEPIQLVKTRLHSSYLDLTDEHGRNVWRLMKRIQGIVSYKSLSEVEGREEQLRLAEEVGRGLAVYGDLTNSIDPQTVRGSLPGYRNTELYYHEFHSVCAGNTDLSQVERGLPTDPELRRSTQALFTLAHSREEFERRLNDPEVAPYVELIREQEPLAMELRRALDAGRIRQTLIHGDTKIENFLFCTKTGAAKSLVDLDTIMPFTWLADWGDMVRSLCNVAGERERDLSKVVVDEDVYKAVARGFLSSAQAVTDAEVAMMARAVQVIALELGMRFLTDYLRGDNYFRLRPGDPPDLNKVRGRVQLTLFKRLMELGDGFADRIASYRKASLR